MNRKKKPCLIHCVFKPHNPNTIIALLIKKKIQILLHFVSSQTINNPLLSIKMLIPITRYAVSYTCTCMLILFFLMFLLTSVIPFAATFNPFTLYAVTHAVPYPGLYYGGSDLGLTAQNDLTLLRLDQDVPLGESVIPVCPPDIGFNYVGQAATVTGWSSSRCQLE